MDLLLSPSGLSGSLTPPPSKSQSHRLLIAAALAQGESLVCNVAHSQDIDATLDCLTQLGAHFTPTPQGLQVCGMEASPMSPRRRMALPRLFCGESGSTLRFLIPVALAVRGGGIFTGRGRLMERPLEPYSRLFGEKGISFSLADGTLTLQGTLEPGTFALPGNVSSQFFTGLLFALPLLEGPSAILPTTQLESMGYIAMTCQALDAFGVQTAATMSLPPQYHVPGGQRYRPARVTVEADWSQAGFWYAARVLGHPVEILGLCQTSLQADRVVSQLADLLSASGDVEIDVSGCPDLVPPLSVMAALREGKTTLVNAARLRLKESDRLSAVAQVLSAMGARVTEGADSLSFRGVDSLPGGVSVSAFGDHRIAMMAALAATRCRAPITLLGAESVDKSYPEFWQEYIRLGGRAQTPAGGPVAGAPGSCPAAEREGS